MSNQGWDWISWSGIVLLGLLVLLAAASEGLGLMMVLGGVGIIVGCIGMFRSFERH